MTKKNLEKKYQEHSSKYTIAAKMFESWWWAVILLSIFTFSLSQSGFIKLFVVGLFFSYSLLSAMFTRLDIRERVRMKKVF